MMLVDHTGRTCAQNAVLSQSWPPKPVIAVTTGHDHQTGQAGAASLTSSFFLYLLAIWLTMRVKQLDQAGWLIQSLCSQQGNKMWLSMTPMVPKGQRDVKCIICLPIMQPKSLIWVFAKHHLLYITVQKQEAMLAFAFLCFMLYFLLNASCIAL